MTEPNRLLSEAAEQVRAFNHVTISTGGDWRFPSHSYDAIGNLAYLLRMLPQAIEQATGPALSAYGQGRLVIDGGGDPGQATEKLRKSLEAAIVHAERLAGAVDGMHSATSPMAFDTSGLPEFDGGGE